VLGKLSNEDLKRLLDCIKKDPKVVVTPQLGFDSGVHVLDDKGKYLVVSNDPCIGVPDEWFGWLLINYVASDVALFGAKMEYCTINLLGSPSTEAKVFHKVMEQACAAADQLDVKIVSGHTGTYEGITKLVGVCTGYGRVNKNELRTPAGAQPNDLIACVKPVGLETVVNFALARRVLAEKLFGAERTKKLAKLVSLQSCVKEALSLAKIGGVNALHDATEGGLVAALNEVAEVSAVGFAVDWDKLLIPKEVNALRDAFGLSDTQVLSMSSTGTILAAVSPEARREVERAARRLGVEARFLGSFTKSKSRILVKNNKERAFPREADDAYTKLLESKVDF
jgi:hydrogenase maturation factor